MDCDLVVVGGGPVGSGVAALTSKGMRTVVLEEHPEVGVPVQCAGLVTPRVIELAGARETILSSLRGAVVHFPGGLTINVMGKETKAFVVDRKAFDQICQQRALDTGATYMLGTKCLSFSAVGDRMRVETNGSEGRKSIETELLVGADGYKSSVSRMGGLGRPRDSVKGIQADLDHVTEPQHMVHIYLGEKVAPGFFAWIIPCGAFTRVGLCVSRGNGVPSDFLRSFLQRVGLSGARRMSTISGVIPIGPLSRTFADRLMVAGDCAAQAKPLSGGGLYTGLIAAGCAGRTALEAFEAGDYSAAFLSRYQERWKAEIGKELDRGYRIRKIFVLLNDSKIDELGRLMSREDVVDILSTGDIDFPTAVAPALLRSIPSLLKFSPQILGSLLMR